MNAVGVDLNMASVSLLSHVAGIGPKLAQNIVAFRDQNGRFENRKELLDVAKLGRKAFEQSAGFLRIRGGEESLDNSAVHPESYSLVGHMARKLGTDPKRLVGDTGLAAAVKSANDAATAIGEAISGSEAAFARRMNRTAKSLGMTRSTFKNAHGLTEKGHLSTARDMTILGRHLLYDYPGYYPMFKRKTTNATKKVRNTNRKFLAAYRGADGIKTGYTHKAGFNLVASAKRDNKRVIATVFGGKSTRTRNNQVAKLLDIGFERSPENAQLTIPKRTIEKILHVRSDSIKVKKSIIPKIRNDFAESDILTTIAFEIAKTIRVNTPNKSKKFIDKELSKKLNKSKPLIVVTADKNLSTRNWKINLGQHNTRFQAEKFLLKAALHEISLLEGARREVVQKSSGFEATFTQLGKENAIKVCVKLLARNFKDCKALGPTGS